MTQRTNTAVEDFIIRIEQGAKLVEVHQVKLAQLEQAFTQLNTRLQSLEKPSVVERVRNWFSRQLTRISTRAT